MCRIGRLRRAINDSVLDPRLAWQRCACSPVRPQQRDRVAGSAGHAGGHFGVGCASTTHLRRCGAGGQVGSAMANTSTCDSRRGGPGVLVGEELTRRWPSRLQQVYHGNALGCSATTTLGRPSMSFFEHSYRCVVSVRALRCWLVCACVHKFACVRVRVGVRVRGCVRVRACVRVHACARARVVLELVSALTPCPPLPTLGSAARRSSG